MQILNIKYYRDLPFEDYLKMSGTSFSGIKGFSGPTTQGMQLGTRVHNYLNEPETYDWQQAELVIPIAKYLRMYLGDAFHFLEKEVAFTADFVHNGMRLRYKGRGDMLKIGRLVVDIKVLAGSLESAIERFGYANQVSGYCLGTSSPMGLIIAYNKLKKKVEVKAIKPDENFWEYQVVRLGEPDPLAMLRKEVTS
jgi:hypothetical protein